VPAKLQNGQPTSLTAKYELVAKQMLGDYPYHGIANNSTQYYSTNNGVNTYFVGIGGLAGSYESGQLHHRWPTANRNHSSHGRKSLDPWAEQDIPRLYLDGRGIVLGSTSLSCAYTQYCAYHGNFGPPAPDHLRQHAVR
jgi:hypothetical protein